MPKDPKRWDEKIISTPFATLTKKDVYDYYNNPAVKNQIMRSVNGGETIIRQNFSPDKSILRRKDPAGELIHMTSRKYDDLNDIRMSEVHPTFGKKVDFLLADVDPKGKVPWQKTKAIAETIAKTLQTHPDVKQVDVRFSGNRGFYVQGQLGKMMGVDAARNMTKKVLDGVARRPDVTFGVPQSGQVRIDTTPLKNRGSVRAPYSLDARTGLVSAPVSLSKLPKAKKTDFTIDKVLKGIKKKAQVEASGGMISEPTQKELREDEAEKLKFKRIAAIKEKAEKIAQSMFPLERLRRMGLGVSYTPEKHPVRPELISVHRRASMPGQVEVFTMSPEGQRQGRYFTEEDYGRWIKGEDIPVKTAAEFAPGIPASRAIKPIPKVENQPWMMAIQRHKALKAGTHYDLRLVDPKTDQAHSFAIPKARLPKKKDRMLLAVQQATHTADYALNFEGDIPKGTYGAGKVTMPFKESIEVIKSNANKIHFQRENGQKFVLFRTGAEGPKWGFKRLK